MTGEITLRGRVLAIGGLKEKLYAAVRAGIKTVIIPEENSKDLIEINKNVLKNIKVIPISEAKLLLKHSLTKPCFPKNISESEHLKGVKSSIIQENLPETTAH